MGIWIDKIEVFQKFAKDLKFLASIRISPLAKHIFGLPGYYAAQLEPWNHYWNLPWETELSSPRETDSNKLAQQLSSK